MSLHESSLLCFAHGGHSGWEAICVDLDIAVQGDTFDDVKGLLDHAVKDYIDAAMMEAPEIRQQLLSRRAPWWITLGMTLKLIVFNILRGRHREAQASFPVLCPA